MAGLSRAASPGLLRRQVVDLGVHPAGCLPVFVPEAGEQHAASACGEVDWQGIARRWITVQKLRPGLAVMIQGNNRLEVATFITPPHPTSERRSRLSHGA